MTSRHGSESFFIVGEGLVNTQMGGRSDDEPDPITQPKLAASVAPDLAAGAAPPFLFSRVGPRGSKLRPALAKKLANAMTPFGDQPEGNVPAGYTYLGQFIDHDLTMDVTEIELGDPVSPAELLQARSPSLDLDSLYGAGPADPGSAKFYEDDGLHLKTGDTVRAGPDREKAGHDLPRIGTGGVVKKRTALIPDPRNDENLIVAQTHLAMIRFHNRVVDKLPGVDAGRAEVPAGAQVGDPALPVADPARLPAADRPGERPRRRVHQRAQAGRADRGPHRRTDHADRVLGGGVPPRAQHGPRGVRLEPAVPGRRRVPLLHVRLLGDGRDSRRQPEAASNWIADWRRMYDFPGGGHAGLAGPNGFNKAQRIDTFIADPLKFLPTSVFGEKEEDVDFNDPTRNLAFRNLTRGSMLNLASGQQMVAHLDTLGVDVEPLTRQQILSGKGGAKLTGLSDADKDIIANRTPLWFYILREAETGNGRLRRVGARIVAETFHRAMEGSRFSIVREPDFRPKFGRDDTFEMTDLLFFAFAGKKSGINPLGG